MFPKQNCPVCQNRSWMETSTGSIMLELQQVRGSKARLIEENEKLVNKIEELNQYIKLLQARDNHGFHYEYDDIGGELP